MTVESARDEVVRAAMAHWRVQPTSPSYQGLCADLYTACLALSDAEREAAVTAAVAAERARILESLPAGPQIQAAEVVEIVNGEGV